MSKKNYAKLLNEVFETKRWNRKEEEEFIKSHVEE